MTVSAGSFATPNVELRSELGRGAMGCVWLAYHHGLETEVVVKYILAGTAATKELGKKRFAVEAKAIAKVVSPHVVKILETGVSEDGPYIVMERLVGESLGSCLKRRTRFEPDEVAVIVKQIAKALEAAHEVGVVHRDIKPDNIYLTRSDDHGLVVKVLDFGVAKLQRTSADSSLQKLTQTGMLVGTPLYMSPEQIQSASNADSRADLWALAVLAYHALTASFPVPGRVHTFTAYVHCDLFTRASEQASARAAATGRLVRPGISSRLGPAFRASDGSERLIPPHRACVGGIG